MAAGLEKFRLFLVCWRMALLVLRHKLPSKRLPFGSWLTDWNMEKELNPEDLS